MNNELYHHGILGQKWGIRRFQNPDGSLTEEGKRRYGSISDRKLHTELKRAFQSERAKQHGGSNRWFHSYEIGTNGQAVRDDYDKRFKDYQNSDAVRAYNAKWDNLNKKLYSGKITEDEYEKASSELFKERPKFKGDDLAFAKIYSSSGVRYANNYLNKGGKTLTIARIKDLGFDQKTAEEFTDRLLKSKLTLGDI